MKWRILYEVRLALHKAQLVFAPFSQFGHRKSSDDADRIKQLLVLGNFEAAYKHYQAAAKLRGFKPGQAMLFELLAGMGKRAEALDTFRTTSLAKHVQQYLGANSKRNFSIVRDATVSEKILVVASGGPGDEIHFSNYYPTLRTATQAELTLTCDPRLAGILAEKFPTISFLAVDRLHRLWADGNRKRLYHASKLPRLSLYRAFDDSIASQLHQYDHVVLLSDILGDLERLRALQEPQLLHDAKQHRGKHRQKIGFAWRSMVQNVSRNRHYAAVKDLEPLLNIPNADFVCLQAANTQTEQSTLEKIFGDRLLPTPSVDVVDDLSGLARLLADLDCVIAPATYLAELGGYVGTPTILLSNSTQNLYRRSNDGIDILMPSMRHCEPDEFSPSSKPNISKAAMMAETMFRNTDKQKQE